MLKIIYEAPVPLTATFSSVTHWSWLENHDCSFLYNEGSLGVLERLYRDGTRVPMGTLPFQTPSGIIGYEHGLAMSFQGVLYHYDPITWTQDFSRIIDSDVSSLSVTGGVVFRDRSSVNKLYAPSGAFSYEKVDLATKVTEETIAIMTGGGTVSDQLHWLTDQQIVAHSSSTGELVVWDVETKTAILRSEIHPSDHMVVDRAHNNIIALRTSDQRIVIYDLTPQATTMSALSFTPGNFERWHSESVSVTVTGSAGELVEGQDMEWSVTGKGTITPRFTKTGSNGVATATYCPAGYDWVLADEDTITAKIVT